MAERKAPTDLYMQWCALEVANSVITVQEAYFNTGLSIRGGLMWLIHLVEFYHHGLMGAAQEGEEMGVSALRGLGQVIPKPVDKGCIAYSHLEACLAGGIFKAPDVHHYLPPLPFAAPNVSLYAQHDSGAEHRMFVRIGFTTTPLGAKEYAELAETWAYV